MEKTSETQTKRFLAIGKKLEKNGEVIGGNICYL
jgi:hypothetical protein